MSTSLGFVSSPWNVNPNSIYYPVSNNFALASTNPTISGTEFSTVVPQCGVYMINGEPGGSTNQPPIAIPTSFSNLVMIAASGIDDAYIIYPNFGIQVFQGINYTDASSEIIYNTTTLPVIIQVATDFGAAFRLVTATQSNYSANPNVTRSIKVFYQGTQLTTYPFS